MISYFSEIEKPPSKGGGLAAHTVLCSYFWSVKHVKTGLDVARGFQTLDGALCFIRSIDSKVEWNREDAQEEFKKSLPFLQKTVKELEEAVKGIERREDVSELCFRHPHFIESCSSMGHVKIRPWEPDSKWHLEIDRGVVE